MGKYVLFLLLGGLFFTTRSFSQSKVRGSVKGAIVDTAHGRQLLADATVSITPAGKDSSEAEYTITDKKGSFRFSGIPGGQYRLLITFQGYKPIDKKITISETNKDIDLGTMNFLPTDQMMEAVIVQRPPITVKKDTVEFNAGNFATKPNAQAEDLIKKIPGMQVDKNGGVTAQGETVSRVLVDGKRFFSDDPKLATRNLPPDVIDKIQVFDDLSDQSKFTGFDDGNRVKTINIVTKKNSRKGYFGKFVAGAGTTENYDESINLHRFDGDQQVSLLGQANDVNKQNFTPQDIFGNGGGGRGRGGGGGGFGGGGGGGFGGGSQTNSGITTVWAGGLNYRNSFGPKTDLYGSYFFNQNHVTTTQQDSSIRSIVTKGGADAPDSTNTSVGGNTSFSRVQNHRIYLNLEQRFDSNNSLVFRPNVTIQQSSPNSLSNSTVVDNAGRPVLTSNSSASSFNSGFNINGSNLQFRHRFKRPFQTLSLDLSGTANVNNGYGYNYSYNHYYQLNGRPYDSVGVINQYYNDSLHSYSISPTLSYTQPVARNQILEINYNHSYTKSTTTNNTYDFDNTTKGYTFFDSLYSNSYKFISNSDRVSLNYRIQGQKMNLSFGSGVQWTGFNSNNTTKGIVVKHDFVNITPTVNFQYQFSRTTHLRFFYNGRTGTPSASQLQPITTTSDKINFQIGNPALKPQFTHSIRALFTNFDPGTQRVMFATVNFSTVVNDIQAAAYNNIHNGQTTTYVNLNGTYNISGYFNYGFPLKVPKSNLNFITNVNYNQSQSLQAADSLSALTGDYQHLYTRNTAMSETISWTTNIKKNFDMNFSSGTNYTINKRPVFNRDPKAQQSQSSTTNTFSQTFSAEITAYTNSGWLISTTLDYTYTNTGSSAYNASVPLLTPSIAKQLFKKKNGELRLTVFDVLNQNQAVSKSVATTSVTFNRTNTLTRYAMLTFTYNLNNFAGQNQRRMPGMFGPGRFRMGGGGGGGGFRGGPGGLYQLY